uniref:Fibronectin type-III domain-containing protein n=1 Tax=Syphacia muris TaxID=451379 RepID=A0A0N5B046_9BILA
MTILWDPPPSSSRNGKIERYETWLTPGESKEAAVIKNVTDSERSITYNFKAQQSYKFKVAAATSEGLGPFSNVLNIYPDSNGKIYS